MSNKIKKGPKPIAHTQSRHFERPDQALARKGVEKSPSFEQDDRMTRLADAAQPKGISPLARSPIVADRGSLGSVEMTAFERGVTGYPRSLAAPPYQGGGPVPQHHSPNSELRTQNSELPGPRIQIIHGGRAAEAMRDMLTLVRRTLEEMQAGESVLVINTSSSHSAMDEVARKISRRQPAKMLVFSASGDALMQRLDFLEHIIETKGVRMIAVSSFEFTAAYSRARNKFVHWLRRLRDVHGISITVYTMEMGRPRHEATHMGPLALLAWTSDRVIAIHETTNPLNHLETRTANTSINELLEELESDTCGTGILPVTPLESRGTGILPVTPDPQIQNSELNPQNYPDLEEALAAYEAARELAKRQRRVVDEANSLLAAPPPVPQSAETQSLFINDLQPHEV